MRIGKPLTPESSFDTINTGTCTMEYGTWLSILSQLPPNTIGAESDTIEC